MQIRIEKTAIKEARKAPVEIVFKLIEAIARYAESRNAAVDVKAMQGADSAFRIRVRDWRLIFTIEGETLTIVKIAPRGAA
jgi:mRNA-degrading endonuclease RelE of RelBE toxin-antitoxin system